MRYLKMKQKDNKLIVNVTVKYRIEISLWDCIKSRIIGTQLMEEHLRDMIDTKDKNIDYEEVVALPCGCKVTKNSKQRYETGQYCLTSNVELHDKCMILYYNNIDVKLIWWILGKENDS